ncbi:GNAT family N-acetyltransferase [Paenibacillus sp. UMB4589-SE434]|uniref:GNAT family N-acetyltransferase n=1 Tax=Paenibacillus sp. UMB4589-SE434 TaxID=3046314 RepID=UPI00254AED07|nr:GNAT family N-acetyltransferase [Paenibacillus sp. UMB4589-SE434]MDK8182422.1 GNAT family N-acetyltransferase [Paenibacillus sp. UMB4589-SE434]
MIVNVIPLEAAWISQICELWNREIGNWFPLREELLRQNSFQDSNVYYPASWLAHDNDGTLIGFVIAKKWQEQEREMQLGEGAGWIQAIVVRSEARGQGIGSRLLTLAEEALQKAGVGLVYMGRDPWHYFPGVPKALSYSREWCAHKGYEQLYEVFDLYASLEADKTIDAPHFEGAYVRLLELKDQAEMLRFFRRCFPGRWYYEALSYWERGGKGREFLGLFVGQEMIGFCRVNDEHAPLIAQNTYWAPLFAEPLGGIGPLGVDDRYRGRGYGLALVQAGMMELGARGMKHLIIDWTELVDFYAKLGFQTWKGYDLMKKELS